MLSFDKCVINDDRCHPDNVCPRDELLCPFTKCVIMTLIVNVCPLDELCCPSTSVSIVTLVVTLTTYVLMTSYFILLTTYCAYPDETSTVMTD